MDIIVITDSENEEEEVARTETQEVQIISVEGEGTLSIPFTETEDYFLKIGIMYAGNNWERILHFHWFEFHEYRSARALELRAIALNLLRNMYIALM